MHRVNFWGCVFCYDFNVCSGVTTQLQSDGFCSPDFCTFFSVCSRNIINTSFFFFQAIQSAGCRDSLPSHSLFNRLGLKGARHKAAESTAPVSVSGVRAKFSKSSQCVSQWQHMLESLQGISRMHILTCKRRHRCRAPMDDRAAFMSSTGTHVHTCTAWGALQIRKH